MHTNLVDNASNGATMNGLSDRFYSLDEAKRYLNVSARTIYRAIESGALRAVKIGRHWRMKREWIDAFAES